MDRRGYFGLEKTEGRREEPTVGVDVDAVGRVEEAHFGEGDTRAAAHARLGALEHTLEVLDWLVTRLFAKVLLVICRVGVDLREGL